MTQEISPGKRNDFISIMRSNPWMVSTIVLAIALVVVLFMTSRGGVTGNVISEDDASVKLLDFVNGQLAGQGTATVVSTNKDGSLYEVVVDFQGEQIPVYITSDGKYIVPQPIPLDQDVLTQTPPETPEVQEIPASVKPEVELFVMSHCPYGTQIEKGILPVVSALGDKIDFQIKFVDYAMHPSQGEVEEQLRQYCIQSEQNEKYLSYLQCFLGEGDSDVCLTEAKIDEKKLDACYKATDEQFDVIKNLEDKSGWVSGQFPQFNIHKAENGLYGVQGSPTLVINGVQAQSGRSPSALLATICSAFSEAPEECLTQLSSDSPSPGFGYGTSGADSAAANCGF
jgi:hypothetical protein